MKIYISFFLSFFLLDGLLPDTEPSNSKMDGCVKKKEQKYKITNGKPCDKLTKKRKTYIYGTASVETLKKVPTFRLSFRRVFSNQSSRYCSPITYRGNVQIPRPFILYMVTRESRCAQCFLCHIQSFPLRYTKNECSLIVCSSS